MVVDRVLTAVSGSVFIRSFKPCEASKAFKASVSRAKPWGLKKSKYSPRMKSPRRRSHSPISRVIGKIAGAVVSTAARASMVSLSWG